MTHRLYFRLMFFAFLLLCLLILSTINGQVNTHFDNYWNYSWVLSCESANWSSTISLTRVFIANRLSSSIWSLRLRHCPARQGSVSINSVNIRRTSACAITSVSNASIVLFTFFCLYWMMFEFLLSCLFIVSTNAGQVNTPFDNSPKFISSGRPERQATWAVRTPSHLGCSGAS